MQHQIMCRIIDSVLNKNYDKFINYAHAHACSGVTRCGVQGNVKTNSSQNTILFSHNVTLALISVKALPAYFHPNPKWSRSSI